MEALRTGRKTLASNQSYQYTKDSGRKEEVSTSELNQILKEEVTYMAKSGTLQMRKRAVKRAIVTDIVQNNLSSSLPSTVFFIRDLQLIIRLMKTVRGTNSAVIR